MYCYSEKWKGRWMESGQWITDLYCPSFLAFCFINGSIWTNVGILSCSQIFLSFLTVHNTWKYQILKNVLTLYQHVHICARVCAHAPQYLLKHTTNFNKTKYNNQAICENSAFLTSSLVSSYQQQQKKRYQEDTVCRDGINIM